MSQSLTQIWTYIIFSTKERYPFLKEDYIRQRLASQLYIQKQKIQHKNLTFKDDFIEFLNRYKVNYNEHYLWD